jgi:hypothetical protein
VIQVNAYETEMPKELGNTPLVVDLVAVEPDDVPDAFWNQRVVLIIPGEIDGIDDREANVGFSFQCYSHEE